MQHGEDIKFCVQCAEVFPSAPWEEITCPECGYSISESEYEKLLNIGSSVFDYHTDSTNKEISDTEYSKVYPELMIIEVSELLKFVSMTVASGVIGSGSWEVTKKGLSKVVENYGKLKGKKSPEYLEAKKLVDSEKGLSEIAESSSKRFKLKKSRKKGFFKLFKKAPELDTELLSVLEDLYPDSLKGGKIDTQFLEEAIAELNRRRQAEKKALQLDIWKNV